MADKRQWADGLCWWFLANERTNNYDLLIGDGGTVPIGRFISKVKSHRGLREKGADEEITELKGKLEKALAVQAVVAPELAAATDEKGYKAQIAALQERLKASKNTSAADELAIAKSRVEVAEHRLKTYEAGNKDVSGCTLPGV